MILKSASPSNWAEAAEAESESSAAVMSAESSDGDSLHLHETVLL